MKWIVTVFFWMNRLFKSSVSDWLQCPLQLSPIFRRALWNRVKGRPRGILIRLAPFPPGRLERDVFPLLSGTKPPSLTCAEPLSPRQAFCWPSSANTAAHWGTGRLCALCQRLAFARGAFHTSGPFITGARCHRFCAQMGRPTLEVWTDAAGRDIAAFERDNIKLLFTSRSVKRSSHTFRQIHTNKEPCVFY